MAQLPELELMMLPVRGTAIEDTSLMHRILLYNLGIESWIIVGRNIIVTQKHLHHRHHVTQEITVMITAAVHEVISRAQDSSDSDFAFIPIHVKNSSFLSK